MRRRKKLRTFVDPVPSRHKSCVIYRDAQSDRHRPTKNRLKGDYYIHDKGKVRNDRGLVEDL